MSDVTLVDSNVLLDIFTEDPDWSAWSGAALRDAANRGLVCINQIIYAEVSVGFDTIEELEDALPASYFAREALPWPAGFLAGKAFLKYRRLGGTRTSLLPDFYIGAHAAVTGYRLLTRDHGRYSTYFPTVRLIAP
ncbi:type II toxin-antitoxin system VapC family toxin [Propionimicrobium sp. PCR01-08-3]|uniref:type II toxin-antitoxin system VapC family toxin n=1 Tax=Propionimicrobium sp. PCR01-08-3 TaxID=3052086 RepID=UPI00255CC50F|nr:type II toxin-antitoxin system VapC family toxin [Propionimicrobium sp. PCR01-08-3]WIY82731.1 type II toxin-antitoxin system VapC family toxin [Propionimicrobium sp. PCR01-08-3]